MNIYPCLCVEYSYFALKWKIGYYSSMLENTFRLSSFFFYLIKFKARIDQQYRDKLFRYILFKFIWIIEIEKFIDLIFDNNPRILLLEYMNFLTISSLQISNRKCRKKFFLQLWFFLACNWDENSFHRLKNIFNLIITVPYRIQFLILPNSRVSNFLKITCYRKNSYNNYVISTPVFRLYMYIYRLTLSSL